MKATWLFSDQTHTGRRFRRRENVRRALFSNKSRPDSPRRTSPIERLIYWQEELHHWQLEVNFFHFLLHTGIYNCKPDSWHKLDYLRHAFSVYELEILPGINIALENTLSGTRRWDGLQGKSLQQEIEAHVEILKKLKMEVFPYLSELLTTPIW